MKKNMIIVQLKIQAKKEFGLMMVFLDFELSRINWAKNHNILADETCCVADLNFADFYPDF